MRSRSRIASSANRRTTFSRQRRGMALIIVMVVVMLVALAAYSFNQQMTDAYQLGAIQGERTEARLALASGIEYGLSLAELPRKERDSRIAASDTVFFRVHVDSQTTAIGTEQSQAWTFSLLRPAITSPVTSGPASRSAQPGWADESSKLNVLTLLQQEKLLPGHARNSLLRIPGATPEVVDTLLTSLDASTNRSSSLQDRLAERTQSLQPDQLLARLWTGGDWDYSYHVDAFENALAQQPDSKITEQAIAWRDLLTFSSGCRNENRSGQRRIYLHDNNLTRLYARLRANWDDQRAAFVIAVRQFGISSVTVNESSDDGSASGSIATSTWTPNFSMAARFRIDSPLDLIDAAVQIPQNEGPPMVLSSPFHRESPAFSQYLEALLDDVSLQMVEVIDGQINVNAAPAEVLMGIPGMPVEIAERIVRTRMERYSASPPTTLGWLITENVVELNQLKPLLPWMTAGGDCFSTQVVAHRDSSSPSYRGTVVLDARQRPAIASQLQLWHPWSGLNLDTLASQTVEMK